MTWAKLILVIFSLTRWIWFAFWLYRSQTRNPDLDSLSALPAGLGTISLIATVNLIIVAWLNILIQTKSLRKNKIILRLRLAMFVVMGVSLPTVLMAHIMTLVGYQVRLMDTVYFIMMAINQFFVFGIGCYGLAVILPWVRMKINVPTNESTMELFASIRKKTFIVTAAVILIGVYGLLSATQGYIGVDLAWRYLVLSSIGRLFEFGLLVIMFLFLLHNSFKHSFVVGYINYFTHSESVSSNVNGSHSSGVAPETSKNQAEVSVVGAKPLPTSLNKA